MLCMIYMTFMYIIFQDDKREAEEITNEEQLLDQDVSVYFSLQTMLAGIDPFHKLWHTSFDFYEGYEKW